MSAALFPNTTSRRMDLDLLCFPSPRSTPEQEEEEEPHGHRRRAAVITQLQPRPVYRGRSDSLTAILLASGGEDEHWMYWPPSGSYYSTTSNSSAMMAFPSTQSSTATLLEERRGASSQKPTSTSDTGHLERSLTELRFNNNNNSASKESPGIAFEGWNPRCCSSANSYDYRTPPYHNPAPLRLRHSSEAAPPLAGLLDRAGEDAPPPLKTPKDMNLLSYNNNNVASYMRPPPPCTHLELSWDHGYPKDLEFSANTENEDEENVEDENPRDEHFSTIRCSSSKSTPTTTKRMMAPCGAGNDYCAQSTAQKQENNELPEPQVRFVLPGPHRTTNNNDNHASRCAAAVLESHRAALLVPTMATPPRAVALPMLRLEPAAAMPLVFAP